MNNLYKNFGLSESFVKLINKEIQIPYLDDYNFALDYWYPHPPCFIPLFLGQGATYKGIVTHFFSSYRKETTYVDFDLETSFMNEIARNEKQFIARMLIDMDMLNEGLTDKIREFARLFKFTEDEVILIDEFCDEFGNIPNEYKKLIFFSDKTPFRYINDLDDYNGEYPSSYKFLNQKVDIIKNSCSYEISKKDILHKSNIDCPEWLDDDDDDKYDLFLHFLNNNQLDNAWFTLNSKTMTSENMARGLIKMKSKTNNEMFHLVSDNWINNWELLGSRK